MEKGSSIKLFDDRKTRTFWNEEEEEWYFSIVDVIGVLADSTNPTDYLKKVEKAGYLAWLLPGDKLSPGSYDHRNRETP